MGTSYVSDSYMVHVPTLQLVERLQDLPRLCWQHPFAIIQHMRRPPAPDNISHRSGVRVVAVHQVGTQDAEEGLCATPQCHSHISLGLRVPVVHGPRADRALQEGDVVGQVHDDAITRIQPHVLLGSLAGIVRGCNPSLAVMPASQIPFRTLNKPLLLEVGAQASKIAIAVLVLRLLGDALAYPPLRR